MPRIDRQSDRKEAREFVKPAKPSDSRTASGSVPAAGHWRFVAMMATHRCLRRNLQHRRRAPVRVAQDVQHRQPIVDELEKHSGNRFLVVPLTVTDFERA
jgi:hypothetical protein